MRDLPLLLPLRPLRARRPIVPRLLPPRERQEDFIVNFLGFLVAVDAWAEVADLGGEEGGQAGQGGEQVEAALEDVPVGRILLQRPLHVCWSLLVLCWC